MTEACLTTPEFARFPSHWQVEAFCDVVRDRTGGNPKVQRSLYLPSGRVPVIDQSKAGVAGYVDDRDLLCDVDRPAILFGDHTRVFKWVDHEFALGADGVKVLEPIEGLDRRFLFHYLRQLQLPENAGYSRHFKFLKRTYVPVPPMVEQKRIASILDKAQVILSKYESYEGECWGAINSAFYHLFAKHLKCFPIQFRPEERESPAGWRWELLNVAARLESGHTPSKNQSAYWDGGIPWISLTDIRNLDGQFAEQTTWEVSQLGIDNSSSRVLPPGTVCLARTASVGFVTAMGRDMATSQDFVNWVCGPDLVPEYLMWALVYSRPWIVEIPDGSTHKTIYVPTVKRFGIAIPPKPSQERFARFYRKLMSLRERQRDAAALSADLFNSLVQRAFRGEL